MRLEDPALLTGHGCFVDDIRPPGTLHMAVLRSPHARARLVRVDAAPALRLPGVIAVLTGRDLLPGARTMPMSQADPIRLSAVAEPVLALEQVTWVGEPVAAVLAESRYLAEDALDAVTVEYDPLPAVASLAAARRPGAPAVHPQFADNVAAGYAWRVGDPDAAFREAPVVVEAEFALSRGHGCPMETRGILCQYDAAAGGLTAWSSTQVPHGLRNTLSARLDLPPERVRVIAPDVGGGFGLKTVYAEDVLAATLAVRTGQPVKWIEDRRENLLACRSDREQVHRVALAATRDGRLLALRDSFAMDLGAFPRAAHIAATTAAHLTGPYRIPHIAIDFRCYFSNRVPVGAYRGAGRPQGAYVIERALDRLAARLGLDPAEVRRRNLLSPADFPYDTGLSHPRGVVYDSGDFPRLLQLALEHAQYDRLRADQAQARTAGRLMGIGLACYVESCSIGMPDGARAWLGGNGQVTVAVGAPGQGQGHRTIWARLAAAALGLAPADVEVLSGDTGLVKQGTGTFGSRSATVTGNAVHAAAGDLARQIRTAAARMLECSPDDVELAAGQAAVRGVPGRAIPYPRLAAHLSAAAPGGPVLEASADWANKAGTWSGGCHLAVVEVEPETGEVRVISYVVAHDSGRILDDQMAAGQVTGGVIQGIGGCLYEDLAYDDQGQPLAATLADYLAPTAVEAPPVDVVHLETPAPGNPLGLKGLGETGIMGPYAAVASAVEDALRPLGIAVDALPLSPARVAGWLRR